jgi:hypothetical protein
MRDLAPIICEFLAEGKSVTVTARGNSMRPMLCDLRDRLTLSPCDVDALGIGDVIMYKRRDGSIVVHRIVDKDGNNFILMGDCQAYREGNVCPDQVLAKLTAFKRKNKEYSCLDRRYLRYASFWTGSYFWRRVYIRLFWASRRFVKK